MLYLTLGLFPEFVLTVEGLSSLGCARTTRRAVGIVVMAIIRPIIKYAVCHP